MTSVTVVDYGAGNLRSLRAALERLDVDDEVTTRPRAKAEANGRPSSSVVATTSRASAGSATYVWAK